MSIFLLQISLQAKGAEPAIDEYELKSVLLFKLINFIEWPESYENFSICILGRDDFGGSLDLLDGRMSNHLEVNVKRYEQSQSLQNNCQMVFISESKKQSLTDILKNIEDLPIVSIADIENFAEQGGMLQFTTNDDRLAFTINRGTATKSNIRILAPLLQMSDVIDREIEELTQ